MRTKAQSPLRAIRQARRINQHQLAMLAKVSQQTISKAERGILHLTFANQELIATILGASRAELFPVDGDGTA